MNRPIGLIAGNGKLPIELGHIIQNKGYDLQVIALKDEASPELSVFEPHWCSWGQIGKIINHLKTSNCLDLIFAGGVDQRPNFSSVIGDLGTIKRLPKIFSILKGGDNTVLEGVIQIFEEEGFKIVGMQKYAPELILEAGVLTKTKPSKETESDISIAMNVVKELGQLDIGQSVVVVGGRVIAVEAAEGTDEILQRCEALRDSKRIDWDGKQGVLVKCVKPKQDIRVDLPTIGPETIKRVSAAKLAGIVVSAGSIIMVERSQSIALANDANLFIKGI